MTPAQTEAAERIGKLADTVGNLVGAMGLQLPAAAHLEGLRASLPVLETELREAYVTLTGQNPWGTHPK